MKSTVIDARTFIRKTKTAISIIFNDNITLYSAQSCYYIMISTVPFIILLLSLAKYVIDVETVIAFVQARIDGQLGDLIENLLNEVVGKTGISLVSLTAVSAIWASSRGVNSVMRGVTEVYGIDNPQAYQSEKLAFVKEHTMIPEKYIDELKGFERFIFSKLYAGSFSKKLYRLFEYKKN